MTKIDQFESVFKAADKEIFGYQDVDLHNILVVTDLDQVEARTFGQQVRDFLRVVRHSDDLRWRDVAGDEYHSVEKLLHLVEEEKPDLICSYRNLHTGAWRWPYSLGSHLDVLIQITAVPVLVLPHPKAERSS